MKLRLPSISLSYAATMTAKSIQGQNQQNLSSDDTQTVNRGNGVSDLVDESWRIKARAILNKKRKLGQFAPAQRWSVDERERLERVRIRHLPTGIQKASKRSNALHPVSLALQRAKENIGVTRNSKPVYGWRTDLGKLEYALMEAGHKLVAQASERTIHMLNHINDPSAFGTIDNISRSCDNYADREKVLTKIEQQIANTRPDQQRMNEVNPNLSKVFDAVADLAHLLRAGAVLKMADTDQISIHAEELLGASKLMKEAGSVFVHYKKGLDIWRSESTRRAGEITRAEHWEKVSKLPPGPVSGSLLRDTMSPSI